MRRDALRNPPSAVRSLPVRLFPLRALGRMFKWWTRRKARQADAHAREESEARYSSLVATMQQVVFQADREGRFTFLNPAWTRIMGYSVEESLGQLHFSYVHPEDRARHRALVRRAASGSGIANYEIRCIARDGAEKWLEAHVHVSVDDDREITGCSGTLTDITKRHQAAEALCASEARYAEQSAVLRPRWSTWARAIRWWRPTAAVP